MKNISCFGIFFHTIFYLGAQINPAVTIAMGVTKKMSLLRTCMFVIAQCGGGIAGAACLYRSVINRLPTFCIYCDEIRFLIPSVRLFAASCSPPVPSAATDKCSS